MMLSHSDSVEYGGWFSFHHTIAFGLVISQVASVGHVTIPQGTLEAAKLYLTELQYPLQPQTPQLKSVHLSAATRFACQFLSDQTKFSAYESMFSLQPIVLPYSHTVSNIIHLLTFDEPNAKRTRQPRNGWYSS